jgi:hypothetical protein
MITTSPILQQTNNINVMITDPIIIRSNNNTKAVKNEISNDDNNNNYRPLPSVLTGIIYIAYQ